MTTTQLGSPKLALIVAISRNGVIGRGGELPWQLSSDLRRFKRLTMGHPLIMGRRTCESLAGPLPGRRNLVVTSHRALADSGFECFPSLAAARASTETEDARQVFVIGGSQLYAEALPMADRICLTLVEATVEGDTFFPESFLLAWPEYFDAYLAQPRRDNATVANESSRVCWNVAEDASHPAGERDEFSMRFLTFKRQEVPQPQTNEG